jgi:hypothetical protein
MYRQALRWGEGNVLLYKKYQRFGMPKLSRKMSILSWHSQITSLFQIHNKADLIKWIWMFGYKIGRLKGSIKFNIFAL